MESPDAPTDLTLSGFQITKICISERTQVRPYVNVKHNKRKPCSGSTMALFDLHFGNLDFDLSRSLKFSILIFRNVLF